MCESPSAIPSHQQSGVKFTTWSYIRAQVYVYAWTTVIKKGRGMMVDTMPMNVSKYQKCQVTVYTHNG